MRRVWLVLAFWLVFGATPAAAAAQTVPTSLEAWYALVPQLSERPPDTLHVGVTLGAEDSRTYLALDLTSIPRGREVRGGVLRLPVDIANSQMPDTATIDVCLAGDPGPAVKGSREPPPAIDCSVHALATYRAGIFTADLKPFAAVMRTTGFALVGKPDGVASWHVAFFAKNNKAANADRISASLDVADEEASAAPTSGPGPEPDTSVADDSLFSASGSDFATTEPFALSPPAAAKDETLPVPSLGSISPVSTASPPENYADSLVFALPLVLLAFVGYFGSALTRPIVCTPRSSEERGATAPTEQLLEHPPVRAARGRRASG